MYDTTTWGRVVPANKAWNEMTKDQVWDNMCRIWDKPENCAVSRMKAGIAQLQQRGLLTSEEAAASLKETFKARRKAMSKGVMA
jgi:hypothetical protein